MTNKLRIAGCVIVALTAMVQFAATRQNCQEQSCFSKSLHHTGEGMRYWYEDPNGLMSITGTPYEKLACKSCHVKSCESCHEEKNQGTCSYSLTKAKQTDTCLQCHARAQAAFALGKEQGNLDVHIAAGMGCTDCHKTHDVHGDGKFRHSMRDDGAVSAACTNCHDPNELKNTKDHNVHRKTKLDCTACHVSNSMACLNCHMENFIETGAKKGNFLPPEQNWVLLINYKDTITAGSVQTAVYKNKKFIAYAPYFTHSIQKQARKCKDCHRNEATSLIKEGKSVPMAEFKDGKMQSFKGVVPLIPDKLHWDFLTKDGDKWVLIDCNEPPKVQFIGHGRPLTEEQLKKMSR
jgi:hypothetical protein